MNYDSDEYRKNGKGTYTCHAGQGGFGIVIGGGL